MCGWVLVPSCAGQRDLRKGLPFGDADLGVRGDEELFGGADVEPTLEQRGRHAGHSWGKRLLDERVSACNRLRVIAEKDADGISFLAVWPDLKF
ncbi:MAG TPA: hypothetical protein VEI26_10520 [Terriglobales bacterium]|nr:hypothetical protein [Terriglobales bacterium]